jgi:hypothetical protein
MAYLNPVQTPQGLDGDIQLSKNIKAVDPNKKTIKTKI